MGLRPHFFSASRSKVKRQLEKYKEFANGGRFNRGKGEHLFSAISL
jgi:hypothetical protein